MGWKFQEYQNSVSIYKSNRNHFLLYMIGGTTTLYTVAGVKYVDVDIDNINLSREDFYMFTFDKDRAFRQFNSMNWTEYQSGASCMVYLR